MDLTMYQETVNGLTLRVIPDEYTDSPREWDNLGTMICFHGRYLLGDKHSYQNQDDFFEELLGEAYERVLRPFERVDTWKMSDEARREHIYNQDVAVQGWADTHLFILPLYLYDHSGLTMNTAGFSCPWDSGQVGWIYATPEQVRRWFGWQRMTKDRRTKVYDALRSEVETYDQYLRNDVWGYEIIDEDGDDVESCWGFYGEDYAVEEGKAMLHSCISNS